MDWTNLAVPQGHAVEQFSDVAGPMFDRIALGQQQNRELTRLRDWLLPLLMNGQVRVA